MKDATCPNCGNYGNSGTMDDMLENSLYEDTNGECGKKIDLAFRNRGKIEGYPIWICNKCNISGVWMKTGFFGKPKPITSEWFQRLKEDWETRTGREF